jgi:hypothetical protein
MKTRLSSRDLFRQLEGREFEDYVGLHDAVLQLFNENLTGFPPGYSYIQLIEWAKENNWIRPANSKGFRISVEAE